MEIEDSQVDFKKEEEKLKSTKDLSQRQISCDCCWSKPIFEQYQAENYTLPQPHIIWNMKFIISTEPYTRSSCLELKMIN